MMKEFFYTITESMLDLGLRGTELPLFAVIYGFSQRGGGCCYLKQDELAKWCGVATRQTINNTINSLIEKGLIRKFIINKDGKNLVAYSYTGSVKNFDTESKKFLHQEVKKLPKECQKILHMNNIEDKKVDNITPFIPPTTQEVAAYVKTRNFADPLGFATYFVEICNNNGWKMANGKGKAVENWKNYIVNSWEKYHKTRTFTPTTAASLREMTDERLKHWLQ